VWLDGVPEDGVVRWRLRSPAGAFRLKLATSAVGRAAIRTGARALRSLEVASFPAPVVKRLVDPMPGLGEPVVVETRGLDRDAGGEWARLGRPAREGVVDRWAESLARLHALPFASTGIAAPVAGRDDDVRPLLLERIALAMAAPRERGLLPESFLHRVEIRLCRLVDEMPPGVAPVPCHGRPRLGSVLLERRAFSALRDFEAAVASDPASDVALAALALGDPSTGLARRFLTAYGAAAGSTADGVSERLVFHVGLELLRCVTSAAAEAPGEVVAAILDGLEAWLDEGVSAGREAGAR
jgi:hypothetical protein